MYKIFSECVFYLFQYEEFIKPVDIGLFPNYRDFIVKPMDLTLLKNNIKAKMYGSTEAFMADTKWIVHNSYIFNSGIVIIILCILT